MLVARVFTFEASHQLPDHPGPCRRLHGHGYRLVVGCAAPVDPRSGLAIDFGDLKAVVEREVIARLDHTHLNDLMPVPSAEHVVAWIWDRLAAAGLPLEELELWETPRCFVRYRGEGLDRAGPLDRSPAAP